MYNKLINVLWLIVFVTVTVASAVCPRETQAVTPNWEDADCFWMFQDPLPINTLSVKVYTDDLGGKYALFSGYSDLDLTVEVYKSPYENITGWATPEKVVSTNDFDEWDTEVNGNQIYLTRESMIWQCDWNGSEASNCNPQSFTTFGATNISIYGEFMYFSTPGTGRFDMSQGSWVQVWINALGAGNGIYVGQNFALVAGECLDSSAFKCESLAEERFYIFEGSGLDWEMVTIPSGLNLGFAIVAGGYVDREGILWFAAGSDWEDMRPRYCLPKTDGYCLGSADSSTDCCPEMGTCVGQGCLTYDCGCVPACTNKVCGSNGCGGSCGTCAENHTCNDNGQCILNCVPDCTNKVCGSNGCGGSCGTCAGNDTCNDDNGQCTPNCTPLDPCSVGNCGNMDDGCGNPVDCGGCAEGYDCNAQNLCVQNCPNSYPGFTAGTCNLTYCEGDPQVTITTGQECSFEIKVNPDKAPALITLSSTDNCHAATLECACATPEECGCVLGCGQVEVIDNGQKVTTIPSGVEGIITGIVGTEYIANKDGQVFDVVVNAGCVYYKLTDTPFYMLGSGCKSTDCPADENSTCEYGTEMNLDATTSTVVIDPPDPVDGDPDSGEEDCGETDGGDYEVIDGDAEVIDGPDASDGDAGTEMDVDTDDSTSDSDSELNGEQDTDNPDGGHDATDTTDTDHKPGKSGGCQTSNNNTASGFPTVLFMALFAILLLRRRDHRAPAKARERK